MKDKYEISLWEDYLVAADNDVPAHYEERKICVIGSDTMTSSYRAFNPELKSNINGTHTFTFKMYYTIKENEITVDSTTFSIEGNSLVVNGHTSSEPRTPNYSTFELKSTKNPFLNLLVNERKVKCYWKGKWYDLIIKNCQEDSNGKSITYTCTDVFINELSKNGFNLTLDTELENNTGTVLDLAEYVLDETDWILDRNNSDVIQQTKEEPVYECTTLRQWNSLVDQTTGATGVSIPNNSKVLVFYEQIQDIINSEASSGVDKELQIAYAPVYEKDANSQLVTNAHCYLAIRSWAKEEDQGVKWIRIGTNPYIKIYYEEGVSSNYRAKRLIKQPISKLDPLTGKYCNVLIANQDGTGQWAGLISENDEIYKYRTTEWDDALIVNNLVVNSKDFINNEGWSGDNSLTFQLYPPYSSVVSVESYTAKSYLHLSNGINFYNGGIRQSSNFIPEGFAIGEKYIFRYKAYGDNSGTPSGSYITSGIAPIICTYDDSGAIKIIDPEGDTYFSATSLGTSGDWVEYEMTCIKSITRTEIYEKKIALFLQTSTTCWLEEAQLFKEVYGAAGVRINPGDIDVQSVSTIKYVYYNHTKSQGLVNPDDITYLWSSKNDWNCSSFLDLQYNDNFEKIRSITVKQSNRFNIIQTLAETFECWAQFIINHDSTGRTIYNNGVPEKYVRFKKDIGQETGIGFIYGIDLKTISRTIQSDKIVTKTIVGQNNNEFATNGFCSIARSKENYPRTNFILNFDYYINQGLLDGGALNNDLYDSTGDIAYYYNLNSYNTEFDTLTELLDAKRLELTKQLSYQTVYDGTITSLQENISNLEGDLMRLANVSSWDAATSWIKANANQDQVKSKMVALETQRNSLATYQAMKSNLDDSISSLQTIIEEKEARQEELITLIKALDLKFYKKYSRFIQEGNWISEEYIDDTLYYLDAQSVAYTSSRPQIQYNISVIRISSIEEFKNKVFHLGDIAFIQDTEFFGYTYVNQIKTPYKEKVLISEVISHFDEPEKDTFKVQNYKTQFEDLFQRITATTQSLQYASGEYARAASIVEPSGTINAETLQNSIALNEQLVYSAQNEAIITDSTGVTVSNTTNPNKKTKVTSGGIFITTDGGATWKNAVRGEGIATQYLTTGTINTNSINIMDGNFKTFRWDESGINAYHVMSGNSGVNLSKFVRFDHYGIYGIDNNGGEVYIPQTEGDIWNDAKFGMTWEGFFVKNKYGTHSVEISSTNDIRVVKTVQDDDDIETIRIGSLNPDDPNNPNTIFGIRISDNSGNPVMESDNAGKLWLKNRLDISSSSGTSNSIGIGYLGTYKTGDADDPDIHIHEVINANNKFIVYEDGSVSATDGEFQGKIIATDGQIGDLTINNANSIQAAIGNSKLRFSEKGLFITNGVFEISNNDGNPIFSFNNVTNTLFIEGTGRFTDGYFKGEVSADTLTANLGNIGGFIINENGLYSSDSELIDNASLKLFSNGIIDAENINLGIGAHINRYIRLGNNAYIWNPDDEENAAYRYFIEVRNNSDEEVVTLNDSGILKIGEITLDGPNSEIQGASFSITPYLASFSNILASGKISTAVFEKGHIQSVGGAMLFKPSYKIESYANNVLTLDQNFEGAVGDYVYVISEDGEVVGSNQVLAINNKIVTLSGFTYNGNLVSLIHIGAIEVQSEDTIYPLIIGVNSSNSTSTFLRPRGITISEFKLTDDSNPKVFLGDLDTSGINFSDTSVSGKRGFGLYSENVYLTGSLTTKVVSENSSTFAGVNTLNGATANVFGNEDTSKIVFWAGSAGVSSEQIQQAPFQVTEGGSIYASRGIFTGAVITESYLRGTDIYAARIHGTGRETGINADYGLAFYDTADGIVFFNGTPSSATEVFSIGNTGFKILDDYFIEINSGISYKGNNYRTIENSTSPQGYIHLYENYITHSYSDTENGEIINSKITFNPQEINFDISNLQKMNISQDQIKMSTESVQMDNTILFGEQMKYEKVSDGYNLFVLS